MVSVGSSRSCILDTLNTIRSTHANKKTVRMWLRINGDGTSIQLHPNHWR